MEISIIANVVADSVDRDALAAQLTQAVHSVASVTLVNVQVAVRGELVEPYVSDEERRANG